MKNWLYILNYCQVSGIVEESAGISMSGKEIPSHEDHSTLLHEHMNQELQGGIVSIHVSTVLDRKNEEKSDIVGLLILM